MDVRTNLLRAAETFLYGSAVHRWNDRETTRNGRP